MKPLFTTDLIINGENKAFDVSFHDESYHFEPEDQEGRAFHVRRREDTWKVDDFIAPIAQQQAISALDHYLLSQH